MKRSSLTLPGALSPLASEISATSILSLVTAGPPDGTPLATLSQTRGRLPNGITDVVNSIHDMGLKISIC